MSTAILYIEASLVVYIITTLQIKVIVIILFEKYFHQIRNILLNLFKSSCLRK